MLRLGQLGYPERLSIRASVQDHQGLHSRFQKLQGYGTAVGKSQLHIVFTSSGKVQPRTGLVLSSHAGFTHTGPACLLSSVLQSLR